MNRNRKFELSFFIMVIIITAFLPFRLGEYHLFVIRMTGIYIIAALGLNVFMGYCGQINLGASAFYCLGAYIGSILQVKLGWHYIAAFPTSMFLTLLIAWAISPPLLRLKGHSMAIGTVAFAMAINLIVDRFPQLTGGSDGMFVPQMLLFGTKAGNTFYYYAILVFGGLCFLFCYFLSNSSIGRAMKSIREDEIAAEAIGIDIHRFKMMSWIVSAVFGGLAGSLYAQQSEFLSPMTFGLMTNVNFVLMIFVGGLGSNIGVVLGTIIITLLSFLLVSVQDYVLLVNGAALFLILRFLPDGVFGGMVRIFEYVKRARSS